MYREVFLRYIKEISDDLQIDQMNISDVSMLAPSKKHFWNQRLTEHKMDLIDLNRKKKDILKKLAIKSQEDSPVRLSISTEMKSLENTDVISEINKNIEDLQELIEFLERNFRTMSNLHMDIKNMIELIKAQSM
jgi:hypothetical protein